MDLVEGRISELAFRVVIGTTFGIAILIAVARLAIRLQARERLALDDYLLVFSCSCLIAGTILLYLGTSAIYFIEVLNLNGTAALADVDPATFLQQLLLFQRINWAYLALTWTSIFGVKFAFLAFFRRLVDRLPAMQMYWRVVVGITLVVFAFAICDGFIACPKLGLAALSCSASAQLNTSLAIGATAISLDIVTDVLILFIPISLLWKVQIKPHQKLGLGIFLCLSIVMVIVAITRGSGLHYHGSFDNSWIYLWQQVEACAAVTMISLTAFRSVFVANGSNILHKKQASPWQVSISRVLKRNKKRDHVGQDLNDLTIPSATLTGMRTLLGNSHSGTLQSETETRVSDEGSEDMKQPKISPVHP